jgi:hypothetical protein
MNKTILIILFSLSLSLSALSQYYYGGLSSSVYFPRTEYMIDSAGRLAFVPKDIGVSVEAGAGFGSYGSGQSVFSTYVAPSFAYNVSNRFRVKAGVRVNNYFGESSYGGTEITSPVRPVNSTSIFVQGDYLVSSKIMISAAVYKDFTPFSPNETDPRLKNFDSEGAIFNLKYRPSERFEINATLEYSNGNRNYLYSPFYNPSPFSSPISSPFSW